MKAVVWFGPKERVRIAEVEMDRPQPKEVVVRTLAAGVCHSDLHVIEGDSPLPVPTVLGHEAAGIVEEVGELVTVVKPGDRVVCVQTTFCGRCRACVTGHPYRCENPPGRRMTGEPRLRLAADGTPAQQFGIAAFAEKMLVHENNVVKIPDDFPIEIAALFSCGVLTGVGAVLNSAKVEPGSTVAVFGVGGVGLSVVMGARLAGARRIIAVDLLDNKLEIALRVGATDVINASREDPVARIIEITGGGADYSFAAAGSKRAYEQGIQCLGPGGLFTGIGATPRGVKIEYDPWHMFRDRKIQGCVMGANRFIVDIPRLVEFYQQGRLPIDQILSRRLRLEEFDEAFRALEAGEVARQVLVFD